MFRRGRRRAGRGWRDPQEPRDDRDETGHDQAGIDRDGPYDADRAPADHVRRLDLGSLRVPVVDGVQVQFQIDQASGQLLTVTLTDGQSGMELSVFAAPKSIGLWDEVRVEIVDSLRAAAGAAEETGGPHGSELRLQLPTGTPGEFMPGRMVGIDGPRWFLRVVFTGYAALDPAAAPLLAEALRRLVVVRGDHAMPLRDPLPLKLPREVTDPHGSDDQADPFDPDPRDATPGVAVTAARMPAPGVRIAEVG
ncbi:DUF3710 domain-containing protein [Candidatus Protofrankia californiensis]|uniref:DUF3710 domain-containing protein n=1 Tax=Candidatus Protofrankia californiensis TaxID=1839754 RepID=UPI00104124A3|nr:DUF3710 domain-containing protein [Candidatus Protofrankia californiensis]